MHQFGLNVREACLLFKIHRSAYYYEAKLDDSEIINRLLHLAEENPDHGFWKLFNLIRESGLDVNHKRIYRLYKQLGLTICKKTQKRFRHVKEN